MDDEHNMIEKEKKSHFYTNIKYELTHVNFANIQQNLNKIEQIQQESSLHPIEVLDKIPVCRDCIIDVNTKFQPIIISHQNTANKSSVYFNYTRDTRTISIDLNQKKIRWDCVLVSSSFVIVKFNLRFLFINMATNETKKFDFPHLTPHDGDFIFNRHTQCVKSVLS